MREQRRALLERARELRAKPTEAEELVWEVLRGRRFLGLKFRRQVPLSGFIVDFLCDSQRLVIEVDGEIHDEPRQADGDRNRDAVLQEVGFRVWRVRNEVVVSNLEGLLRAWAEALTPPGPPLPRSGRGGRKS
jgi:very-short-patch-repair endonuclease